LNPPGSITETLQPNGFKDRLHKQTDGCIVLNAHNAVFGSKRSTICATV